MMWQKRKNSHFNPEIMVFIEGAGIFVIPNSLYLKGSGTSLSCVHLILVFPRRNERNWGFYRKRKKKNGVCRETRLYRTSKEHSGFVFFFFFPLVMGPGQLRARCCTPYTIIVYIYQVSTLEFSFLPLDILQHIHFNAEESFSRNSNLLVDQLPLLPYKISLRNPWHFRDGQIQVWK